MHLALQQKLPAEFPPAPVPAAPPPAPPAPPPAPPPCAQAPVDMPNASAAPSTGCRFLFHGFLFLREKCVLKRKRPCINENGRPTTSTSRHAMHLAWCLISTGGVAGARSRSSGKRSGSLWRCDRQCAARGTRRAHSPPDPLRNGQDRTKLHIAEMTTSASSKASDTCRHMSWSQSIINAD